MPTQKLEQETTPRMSRILTKKQKLLDPMNQQLLFTISGIRDDGNSTVFALGAGVAGLTGHKVVNADKPIARTWHARSNKYTTRIARSLLEQIEPGSDLLMHSYGALLGIRILQLARESGDNDLIRNFVMVAPAADRNAVQWEALSFERGLVLTNPLDIAIFFGSINPRHPFGWAGAAGFKTDDPRMTQEVRLSTTGPFNHTKPWFGQKGKEWTCGRIARFLGNQSSEHEPPPGKCLEPCPGHRSQKAG
jgi:pimeloyl-ACP methyl ester carboxylesterase